MHKHAGRVVELVCSHCGRRFTRPRREYERCVRRGLRHAYCSRGCQGERRQKHEPARIPWLRPRTGHERMLAEMIAGAAIEYQRTLPGKGERPATHAGEDYWSGYWAALIDYGRRIFNVPEYGGPRHDDEEAKTPAEDGAHPLPEAEVSRL